LAVSWLTVDFDQLSANCQPTVSQLSASSNSMDFEERLCVHCRM
jgi:hypothetical protein